jgi:adenylyltransferase/sulfurtransferase
MHYLLVASLLGGVLSFEYRTAIRFYLSAPLVSGAAIRMDGQLAVFDLRQPDSACYACVYGDGTDGDLACSQAGIVGPVVGTIGTLQALAAIQVLLGNPLPASLRLFDGRTLSWREMRFQKDPACPVCSRR